MELPCRWLGLQEPRTTRRNEEMIRRHQCQGNAFLSAGASGETPRSSGSLGARMVSMQSMPRLRHRFLLVCLRANLQHQQYVLYNTCSLHVGHRAYRFFFPFFLWPLFLSAKLRPGFSLVLTDGMHGLGVPVSTVLYNQCHCCASFNPNSQAWSHTGGLLPGHRPYRRR